MHFQFEAKLTYSAQYSKILFTERPMSERRTRKYNLQIQNGPSDDRVLSTHSPREQERLLS